MFARSLAALLCLGIAFPGFSQTRPAAAQSPEALGEPNSPGIYRGFETTTYERPWLSWFSRNYVPRPAKPVSWGDSSRLGKLTRAGNIYLSLRDAVALALENNLDIEYARWGLPQAESNLLRAQSGNLLTNISNTISSGPSSASGVLSGSGGFGSGAASASSSSSGQQGVLSGISVQLAGSAIPSMDPVFFTSGSFSHQTQPLTSTLVTGTNFLVTSQKSWAYGLQQETMFGGTATLYMNNTFGYWQNSPNNDFNPSTTSSLAIQYQQNLLKGFRPSVNSRQIRIAKNQLRTQDLSFKQQVIATVNNVVTLYWDLVNDCNVLRVRQQSLELNTKLYEDNKRRAELGAIAPIDIIQAEAEMKAAQQEVRNAEAVVLQQEMILKGVLTRSGLSDLAVISAHVIPTDEFQVPAQEPARPVQDLIADAFINRADLEQTRINMEDSKISMLGVKDNLLPSLSVTLGASNSGLAGSVNTIQPNSALASGFTRNASTVNSFFLGGYGTVMDQLFSRKFPNYSASFSFTMPIRNRQTQADLIAAQLQYRQSQIQAKQLENNTKINVINNRTSLTQARAAWESAVEARKLQQQTQQATRRRYELGTATILDVVTVQQTTVARELSEAQALNTYIKARLSLDNTLGTILEQYHVSVDEAKSGVVGREADLIPAVPPTSPIFAPGAARK
jgi:outer membrane protein